MKGWKTFLFNIIAAIVPVLEAGGADLGLEGQGLALYTSLVALGNIVLRWFTSTAMFKSE